jgi:2-phospho-L-lactate transferase/gluconeogenesis factor (CofD/UPF0052 family)
LSLKVVALGGGHGLTSSPAALRRVTDDVTAVVTVADDGGSSGRLRQESGVLPPGDLRMALAALCGDDDWGTTWSRVAPQPGETEGFSPHRHLEVLADHAPSLSFDVVLADRCAVSGAEDELEKAAGLLHASLVLSDVAAPDGARHDPLRLAAAYRQVFTGDCY